MWFHKNSLLGRKVSQEKRQMQKRPKTTGHNTRNHLKQINNKKKRGRSNLLTPSRKRQRGEVPLFWVNNNCKRAMETQGRGKHIRRTINGKMELGIKS